MTNPPAPARPSLRDTLEKRVESRKGSTFGEMHRILSLPVQAPMTPEELEAFNKSFLLRNAYNEGFRLFQVQAEAIQAYRAFNGFVGAIGVGWGKTLISLATAQVAFSEKKISKILLLVPPQVYDQLTRRDLSWARKKIPFSVPVHRIGGLSAKNRGALARSGRPGLYIMPYSYLSTQDAVDLLEGIAPRLVIADEAHLVKGARPSARARRLRNFLTDTNPHFVALSGTITTKSVMDYHALLRAALHEKMPLPMPNISAQEWCAVLDAEGDASQAKTGSLLPLIRWAINTFPEITQTLGDNQSSFREAYRLRFSSAPGVVCTGGDESLGTTLTISNYPVEHYEQAPGWSKLAELMDQVQVAMQTPDGDEIEYGFHTWKWLYELSSGGYNSLRWPSFEDYARRKRISESAAEDMIERAKEHHALLQVFHRQLRNYLAAPLPRLDTPLLVTNSLSLHGSKHLPETMYSAWLEAKEAEFPGMPERDSIAVRICPYKIDHAVDYAKAFADVKSGAILWYYHDFMGEWLVDELRKSGISPLWCPAGQASNRAICDPDNQDRIVVASISAHGTGKNLQHFQEQLFVQWPRQADRAEQALGRLHRNGQTADAITAWRMDTTSFDLQNFAACLVDAVYAHTTTGTRQKLVYCQHDPMPKVYPPEFLAAKGFQNHMLTGRARQTLFERFELET